MYDMKEAKEKQSELRKAIKQWKKDHPDWLESEAMQTIRSKVSESTFMGYRTSIPIFCYFEGKTPDQIYEERDSQLMQRDRKIRYYYEDRMNDYKKFLVEYHFGGLTIKNYLNRVAGFFSNNRLDLKLDNTFWKKADKDTSELIQATEITKRYPDNDEIRLIIELAPNHQTLAILFGYQCGLSPTDIVSLTWENLNIDFETEQREFIHVDNTRDKSDIDHVFIINPDLFNYLKARWIDSEKPTSGWIFTGYKEKSMTPRNLNTFFKEHAIKALGVKRGNQLVFKDLRDSYNEAILDSNVNEEIKDILMGHKRVSAKGNYSFSIASVVKIYREQIFPRIAVNGWGLKQKASERDVLKKEVIMLKEAILQLERTNTNYETRLDNLKEHVTNLEDDIQSNQAAHVIFMNRIMKYKEFDFLDTPTEEEINEYLDKQSKN